MEPNKHFRTLVLGASNKPGRFSFLAIKSLAKHNVEVLAIGARNGEVDGVCISTEKDLIENIHTVSLYLNPKNQSAYIDYIIKLKPKRIIFNPGTENPELLVKARAENIKVVFDCTLVMLNNGSFFQ